MGRTMTEIATGVLVTHSRRDTTASTVLADNGRAVLIDPAWDPDELDDLAQLITSSTLGVVAGFATHAHHDHLLWHRDFGDVPRWASPAATRTARAHRAELVNSLGPDWPERLAALVGLVEPLAQQQIPWPGPTAEIIVHDGHAPGHAAVWLESSRVLLAGDMLSDIELPLADETGLEAYDLALDALAPYVRRARSLVPGHGHPTDSPMTRWAADRRYLDAVLAGRPVEDPRLATPGMASAHAANLALR
jgi:glyoxylase-like metal-dependent hydrolase (beta-lactamase superfamily II)